MVWNFSNNYLNFGFNYNNFSNFNAFNSFGYNNMPFVPYTPLFTFMPTQPQYNFKFNFSYTPLTNDTASGSNNLGITDKQKAQIEEISKIKYDSENLRAKLDENKDINSYVKYLENNKEFTAKDPIIAEDGGKIICYVDKNGKRVGSVNKDANGNVRNVGIQIGDESELSLNDNNNDGTIDSRFGMSKMQNIDVNEKTFDRTLTSILTAHAGYTMISEKRNDGTTCEHYTQNGKPIADVAKDCNGKIIALSQYNDKNSQGVSQNYFYNDHNKDGIIDTGEAQTRFDIDLS